MVSKKQETPETEDFGALLDEYMGTDKSLQGKTVSGTVTRIDDDEVIVDVGLK